MKQKKPGSPLSFEQAEQMLTKPFRFSDRDRELFEKIVNSNPALLCRLTWRKMWLIFFDELFPRPHRFLSLSLTMTGVVVAAVFMWNIIFSTLAEPFPESQPIVQERSLTPLDGTEVAWEDNLNSIIVGRFWNEP